MFWDVKGAHAGKERRGSREGMRFRVAVTFGWEVATKTKNHQEAEKRARATQESDLERRW